MELLRRAGSSKAVSEVQFEKAPLKILSPAAVSAANVTLLSAAQFSKAFALIEVSEPGMLTLVRAVQPEKALAEMVEYPSGIVTDVIRLLSLKASPICSTVYSVPLIVAFSGNTISVSVPL